MKWPVSNSSMKGFRLFLKRCNCAIRQIMTQIDKFSIVQERTELIWLLLFSRNKRKGKTIVRWQGVVQKENRYLLPHRQYVLNVPSNWRRNRLREKGLNYLTRFLKPLNPVWIRSWLVSKTASKWVDYKGTAKKNLVAPLQGYAFCIQNFIKAVINKQCIVWNKFQNIWNFNEKCKMVNNIGHILESLSFYLWFMLPIWLE